MSYDYLILTEKKDAFNNYVKALGGETGTINGRSYRLVHAQGHLMQLMDPEYQVSDDKKERYKSWNPATMPWDLADFAWRKRPRQGAQIKRMLRTIKDASKEAQSVIIATDDDPSGEGELIAWEILIAIQWDGPVLRAYPSDEEAKSIKKAFGDLKLVSNRWKDGDFLKSDVRNKWDFMSMQLTRLATSEARQAGYNAKVVNLGRLKSAMVGLVYQRLLEIANYHRTPYYEVKYRDANQHIYARKVPKGDEEKAKQFRFAKNELAVQDLAKFANPGHVVIDKTVQKHQAPKTLVDLAKIDAILSKQGFASTTIENVYQQLYQEHYVSYPRTGDKFITTEQFGELVQNAKQVAQVVGVDPKLLTHWEPRTSLVKNSATHGANRYGGRIPQNLDEIRKAVKIESEGDCAVAIYKLVAKSTLAIFGDDYVYEVRTAHIQEHPDFISTYQQPISLNYKQIYDLGQLPQTKDDFSSTATPQVFEGANPKPSEPTKEWLYKRLQSYGKQGIGTPATQQSTLADLTNPRLNTHMFTNKRGKLGVTDKGTMAALLGLNTYIADPHITVQLFEGMDKIGNFQIEPQKVLNTINTVVNHDKPVIAKNVSLLEGKVSKRKPSKLNETRNYREISFQGETKRIKTSWGSHNFTDQEIEKLSNGEEITFDYLVKGHKKPITGRLAEYTFHGKQNFGFQAKFDKE